MTTETVASYQQYFVTVLDVDHIILGIKACHDAHILFCEQMENNDNVYEVCAWLECFRLKVRAMTAQYGIQVYWDNWKRFK